MKVRHAQGGPGEHVCSYSRNDQGHTCHGARDQGPVTGHLPRGKDGLKPSEGVCVCVCVHMSVCVYMSVCVCLCLHIRVCECVYMSVCEYMSVCVTVCE